MNHELSPTVEQKLDTLWFDRYAEQVVDVFALLDGEASVRSVEKATFLQNESGNPTLDYPKLETFDFTSREKSLLELKAEIISDEKNPIVREIYRTKINETIAELRMLQATRLGDDKRFARYSAFVYGFPDAENTEVMSSIVQEKVARGKTDEKKAAADVLGQILETQVAETPLRGDALVTTEKNDVRIQTVEEVVSAFEAALVSVGAVDGWAVVVNPDAGITNFRVSQREKTVYIPAEKAVGMLEQEMHAFIQHEVYGHVQRRIAGENSKLKLLSLGLDRVEKGEEGVATYLEQNEKGADSYSHPERYFAIALARGEVDGVKRDFRETFEVLQQYYVAVLKGSKTGPTLQDRAKDWAWRLTVRVFRGTTGNTPGAVFTKDLNYFVGNRETWALVNTDESIVEYFTIGKFDTANARHVGWLTQLGITDEALQQILEDTFMKQKSAS
jgi:hypothetical protein